eukprot:Nitzschia sp. Nitz4//scaffold28_size193895//138668//139897//NITZ4_001676-RA/size193895-augustus-gene-0.311-mRNA-1//-1//CDS//3329546015//1274//frame0
MKTIPYFNELLLAAVVAELYWVIQYSLSLAGLSEISSDPPTISIDTDVVPGSSMWEPSSALEFLKDDKFHDVRAPTYHESIPLDDLVRTGPDPSCDSTGSLPTYIVPPIFASTGTATSPPGRHIPKIIHVTSKSRCLTETFRKNLDLWHLEGYSLYFHDDTAVDRLLAKYVPAFPHLQLVSECTHSGAGKADIWRYLVLWEYGGVYTDIDNAPGPKFENGTSIQDDDEAFFIVERLGVLSQYFMASSPRHPFMYIALMECLARLVNYVDNIGDQFVPYITGPGVTKAAMQRFMKDEESFQKVKKGSYTGIGGKTVTVKGTPGGSNSWIMRESVKGKHEAYEAMGMVHFNRAKSPERNESCFEHLYQRSKSTSNTSG